MALRTGVGSFLEQDRANGEGPKAAYLDLVGSEYVWATGSKAADAAAFLQDSGSGVFVLNNDSAEEDRPTYVVGTSNVMI